MRCAAAAAGTASAITSRRRKRNVFMARDSFSSTRPFSGMTARAQNENAGREATGVGQMSGRGRLLQLGDGAAVLHPRPLVGADRIRTLLAVADGLDARRRHAL